jgi:hypothetical protein
MNKTDTRRVGRRTAACTRAARAAYPRLRRGAGEARLVSLVACGAPQGREPARAHAVVVRDAAHEARTGARTGALTIHADIKTH